MHRSGEGLYERIRPALRADPTMSVPKWSDPDDTDAAKPPGFIRSLRSKGTKLLQAFTATGTDCCLLTVTETEHPLAGRS
ncbi:hypothetical protein ACFWTC_37890 [Streptomyces sp. NPDC058619]|uniref:hypothetical protein n=1 Tax=unclassified Streptomyces TaxID=2593676 RepID=UPI0036590ED8